MDVKSKLHSFFLGVRILFLYPLAIVESRISAFMRRHDKRPKRYLQFEWPVTPEIEDHIPARSLYAIAGPWNYRTARRHGRRWFGKHVVILENGLWAHHPGEEFSKWYFSNTSAAADEDPNTSAFSVLTANGREAAPSFDENGMKR